MCRFCYGNDDNTEESLPCKTRRTLAQLRDGKSPFLLSYKNKIDPFTYPSPLCPLCKIQTHDTSHLFNCPHILTHLNPMDLWLDPVGVAALLAAWGTAAGLLGEVGGSWSPAVLDPVEWTTTTTIPEMRINIHIIYFLTPARITYPDSVATS